MADGNVMLRAAKIVESDSSRRYVVVSAPEKRFGGDVKVTDLLYQLSDAFENGDNALFDKTFEKISARFLNIQTEIGKDLAVKILVFVQITEKVVDKVKAEIIAVFSHLFDEFRFENPVYKGIFIAEMIVKALAVDAALFGNLTYAYFGKRLF